METICEKMSVLFDELVPVSGKADSLAGEIVRAASRVGYRFLNDGDQLGIGYGKETCNPAGRFLLKRTNEKIAGIVSDMFGLYSEEKYEDSLKDLLNAVVEYVEENPELRHTETEDMYDYYDESEDVDDDEDDDDYYDDDEEEW